MFFTRSFVFEKNGVRKFVEYKRIWLILDTTENIQSENIQ